MKRSCCTVVVFTHACSEPPFLEISRPPLSHRSNVQKSTQSAPEFGVDESAFGSPFKEFIVKVVELMQFEYKCSEFFHISAKIVAVNERVWWSETLVILTFRTHDDRYYIISTNIKGVNW